MSIEFERYKIRPHIFYWLRIFDRFGFNLPKIPTKERKGARLVTDHSKWQFVAKYHDWLNTENGLTLTGFVPDVGLFNLLESGIDRFSE
jgi:hypothetical protein